MNQCCVLARITLFFIFCACFFANRAMNPRQNLYLSLNIHVVSLICVGSTVSPRDLENRDSSTISGRQMSIICKIDGIGVFSY